MPRPKRAADRGIGTASWNPALFPATVEAGGDTPLAAALTPAVTFVDAVVASAAAEVDVEVVVVSGMLVVDTSTAVLGMKGMTSVAVALNSRRSEARASLLNLGL